MMFFLIFLFMAVLTFCLSQRFLLKSYKDSGGDPPKSVLSGVIGFVWPVSLPCILFAWLINKVLDKFAKV